MTFDTDLSNLSWESKNFQGPDPNFGHTHSWHIKTGAQVGWIIHKDRGTKVGWIIHKDRGTKMGWIIHKEWGTGSGLFTISPSVLFFSIMFFFIFDNRNISFPNVLNTCMHKKAKNKYLSWTLSDEILACNRDFFKV